MKVIYKNFNSHRRFGVELEFNKKISQKNIAEAIARVDTKREIFKSTAYHHDVGNNYWHVKFDRSCGDKANQGGWEVASFVASGYQDVKLICKVADELTSTGVEVNNNCGLHVHIETNDLNKKQITYLAGTWFSIEPIVMMSVPEHRRNNVYCKMISKIWNFKNLEDPNYSWEHLRPKNFDNKDRRQTINFCNHCAGNAGKMTVEFRFPEGTSSGVDIKNWVRLFICFVEKCKKGELKDFGNPLNLTESLYKLGLGGNDEKFYILSPALKETKIWLIDRIIKHSDNKKILEEAKKIKEKLTLL
jgi:hypothetical protein